MMGKKNKIAMNKINLLPSEIEENILSRLPVKTILRFMSVCKSWYSLFSDPYFINIHHKTNQTNYNNLLLVRLRSNNDVVAMDTSLFVVQSRLSDHPQFDGVHDYERSIVGSYNGIVCVHGVRNLCIVNGTFNEYFCLWNPVWKTTKDIMNRVGHLNWSSGERAFIGFGFHNQTNDYNVLRFQKSSVSVETKVEIYSWSLDSWRTLNVTPPHSIRHFFMNECYAHASVGVYVNGAHHWVVGFRRINEFVLFSAIISFDMGEEVFKNILIPSECMKSKMLLFNNNESLAMLTLGDHPPYIWVMKVYGLHESWTKLCKIDKHERLGTGDFRLFIQTKNEVIFSRHAFDADRSIVFYIDKSVVKDTSLSIIEVLKDAIQVIPHTESLLLLNSTSMNHPE